MGPSSEVGRYTNTKKRGEVKRMKVVMLVECNTPKETERNKKRYQFSDEHLKPYWDKKDKEVNMNRSGWSDGSGTVITWMEFETLEDFNKVWGDEEFQILMARWSYNVDNVKIRILRPTHEIPPK